MICPRCGADVPVENGRLAKHMPPRMPISLAYDVPFIVLSRVCDDGPAYSIVYVEVAP